MDDINIRGASFAKNASMFMVMAALVYMYAYTTDGEVVLKGQAAWLNDYSKANIFYAALVLFGVLNLLMGLGLNLLKSSLSTSATSSMLGGEAKRKRLLVWFTYSAAAINFFMATTLSYIAFLKIDGASRSGYIYIPYLGLMVLVFTLIGLIVAWVKK